jgi:polysaccharide deacetylase 2 family uncharacterized protein YibQ
MRLPAIVAGVLLLAMAGVAAVAVTRAPTDPHGANLVALPLPPRMPPRAAPVGPSVGLIVTGLGTSAEETRAAIALPASVGLAFSPYGAATAAWMATARAGGHETFLELPLQSVDPARIDQGPLVLEPDAAATENLRRLNGVLGAGDAPVGVVAAAGAYAERPETFAAIAAALAARGLVLVELGGTSLAEPAAAAGLRWRTARGPLEADLSPTRIDEALETLGRAARTAGTALGFVAAYPVTLSHVEAWLERLDDAGLTLLPPTETSAPAADGWTRES